MAARSYGKRWRAPAFSTTLRPDMTRTAKWTADDLAALETLVKRHGVAAVTRKALQVMVAKKKPGSPARPAADAQIVWLAIEVRRQRLVRAGFKGAVSKAAQELAAELKVKNPTRISHGTCSSAFAIEKRAGS